jgi:hypothetical protein
VSRTALRLFILGALAGPVAAAGGSPPQDLTVTNATFVIPRQCRAQCSFGVDSYAGSVTCADLPVSITYGASPYDPPLASSSPAVLGRRVVSGVTVYWGMTPHHPKAFCGIVPSAVMENGRPFSHYFCTLSDDGAVRDRILQIVGSMRFASPGAAQSCGLWQ